MHFFINGSFLSEKEAFLSVLDLGLLRGYAVFDYLRTYDGKPFHLDEHLARFFYSASKLEIEIPFTPKEAKTILLELIKKGGFEESSLKFFATGGVSSDQLIPQGNGSFIAFVYPLTSPPETCFKEGILATTTYFERCLPDCKTTQYLPAILSLKQGKLLGAYETLYVNSKQEILEGATSNFFAFKQGVLITPPDKQILIGITRDVILNLCKDLFPIEVREIPLSELPSLEEAFITASNKEVMPVIQIDQTPIGNGKVGPLTKKVMDLFATYTKRPTKNLIYIPRYEKQLLKN